MKANEAPERVYCTPTEGGFYITTIKPEPPFAEGVEYIRKDAFIEKAEKFIYSALNDGIMGTANIEDFMRLFKKYMKGE